MAFISRIAAAFAVVLALAAPALAQGISDAQHQALSERIASFDTAMRANDMEEVMSVVPPPVLEKVAAMFSVTVEQLIEATQQQMDEALKTLKFESFSMELEGVEFVTLDGGIIYGLVPTESVIDLGEQGGKMKSTTSTLALLDGETWYLVRIDDAQQVQILKEVYPAFAEIEFPQGTIEPVTQ
ncbi:MAG TPA: hypothetical protein VIN06_01930 [Devosia sp.]